jgi:hypothetical protein
MSASNALSCERGGDGVTPRKTNRRQFTKTLAALTAAPLLLPTKTVAAQPEGATTVPQVLTEMIRLRHGKHLSEEQMKRVRQRIEALLASAERLKKINLKNSDEPAVAFSADVP